MVRLLRWLFHWHTCKWSRPFSGINQDTGKYELYEVCVVCGFEREYHGAELARRERAQTEVLLAELRKAAQ